jgi:peptidoglycan/xylan/chitin deacetylase (PgdA/CDA1 family)
MMGMKFITTSWDDGHVNDFRLAELLEKYKLPGTFYIPAFNEEHEVMSEIQVVELSKKFEIGGHTIHHKRIHGTSDQLFKEEILGCYTWLTQLTGKAPESFCFPGGVYNSAAIEYALNVGFKVVRTTELLNPWMTFGNPVLPTTLQVYPHSSFTYTRHLLKRFKFSSLMMFLKSSRSSSVRRNLEVYLDYIEKQGGCFHLWGHSWEIEEFNLWAELERLLKTLSGRNDFHYVNNAALGEYLIKPEGASDLKNATPPLLQ